MSRPMKDSGVEWIGEIPDDWEISKIKYVASINDDTLSDKTPADFEFNYVDIGSVTLAKGIEKSERLKFGSAPSRARRIVQNHDIIVSTVRTYLKAISSINDAQGMIVSTGFAVIRPRNVYSNFLGYFLKSDVFTERVKKYSTGVSYPSINASQLKNFKIILPSYQEQQKIAAFLDEKTAQIDSIIDNTKQSIVEFKKYKQALITETVTKGLNLDVKMKDSGIEWIGEIPEHWETRKMKQLFEIKKVIAGRLGHDILSITQNGLKIKDISNNEGQISADYSKYQIVDIGDFAMNHMDLLTGWVDCATFSGVTSPDYRVFKSRKPQIVDNNYYKYIFQACYSNKIFYGLGQGVSNLGRWRLPTSNFLNFAIPHSPIEEQQKIANYLDEETAHIDTLIANKEKMVQELEAYKKAMIYEYVTGKKEVE